MKLSIIIPVYKAEKYIAECLDSLEKQLTPDVEVLLIDDCSPDGSANICRRYVTRNDNIKLLSQSQNMGVSAARNRGLDEAQGEYITFIDSDDFVCDNYISKFFELCESGFDLSCFGNYNYVHNGDEVYTTSESNMNCSLETKEPQNNDFETLFVNFFFACPWNKIFKKALIGDARFNPKCVCYEDYLFNIEYCRRISSFKIISDPLYYYRQDTAVAHVGKRKWGERFYISNLVAENTDRLISEKKDVDLSFLRRYTYGAFMTELRYVYKFKPEDFDEAVKQIRNSASFYVSICAIKPTGRYLTLLKIAIRFKLHNLLKKLLSEKC